MKITAELLRYTYHVLSKTVFHDIKLPAKMAFQVKPLRKAWGYYYDKPEKIEIAAAIECPRRLLMVVAHEMVHAALEQTGGGHHDHGKEFQALANVICKRMGWKRREF